MLDRKKMQRYISEIPGLLACISERHEHQCKHKIKNSVNSLRQEQFADIFSSPTNCVIIICI